MTYLSMNDYELWGFRKSKKKFKKYDAILHNINTDKLKYVSFGDVRFGNYRDITGLNLYPDKIHGDSKRRRAYRLRHRHNLKDGYYSPSYFSYYYLW